ncbi:integrase catalytic domain-containing protein [Trichonephila clavipes]|uniref:Integrase catalytic domain-containing protein n=1 Tax=Trichonephila clavipes TaxID=2585209 RepID=A0A8X6RYQ7_TRICX|nr:integrase catalytic domain-containing protein [Trichonephila clavipes]
MKEVVAEHDNSEVAYYMPHHGVLRPEKSTTKLRVVFNATNPTSNGLLLNSIQYNGGLVQNDLFTIMIKFREHPYAFTADVKMMYRMILIHESQQPLLRILWKESPEDPVKTFEMKTVTYGTVSAPFLATRTLLQLSRDEEKNFPLAAPVLRELLYGRCSLRRCVFNGSQGLEKPTFRHFEKGRNGIAQVGAKEWHRFLEDFNSVRSICIGRCIVHPQATRVELHGFADASEKCYGAVIYCRSQSPDGATTLKLVTSKSRVAPVKSVTMPRLELCAAVLLAKLMKRVETALQMKTPPVYLWSDSTIVLAWIQKEPNLLKTFVANRVATIQHLINAEQWHHVSSKQNPADLISRGLDPSSLLNNSLWWNGRQFLTTKDFPEKNTLSSVHSKLPRRKKERTFRCPGNQPSGGHLNQDCAKLQEFKKDILSLKENNRVSAESLIKSLNPFLDKDGVAAVAEWYRYRTVACFVTGPQALLYQVRQRFWPLRGRNVVGLTLLDRFGSRATNSVKAVCIRYVSIFVCFVTKAVHFELVSDLTTQTFIASLKRFIARRGRPSLIFSDNGKTFIGANAELKRLYKLVINPDPELAGFLVDENINWKFLPPRAPNFGGLWEAGVKSLNSILNVRQAILGLLMKSF